MKLTTITYIALLSLAMLSLPATAQAGDGSSYEAAKAQNRGHVGIHKRREAFREHIVGKDTTPSSVAEIAPAAGNETEDSTTEDAQVPAMQKAPEYNQ